MRTRLSVALCLVGILASVLASAAYGIRTSAPAGGARANAAHAGTIFDPNTGTITVNVDLIGAEDANGNEITFKNPDNGQMQTAKQAWEQKVNEIWNGLLKNGGFKKFLFHANCPNGNEAPGYRLHMNFILNPLPPGSKGTPGHHHVTLADPSHTIGHDVTNYPNAPKGWGKDSPNDQDFGYTGDLTGQWGLLTGKGATTTQIAHEVGHMIGLGDDDTRDSNGVSNGVYDHRSKDTVMWGGRTSDKVNQNLVDRIAKQIQKNYKIPRDCGDYRYDISIVTSARNQYSLTNTDPLTYAYETSDRTFTWTGEFPDVPIKVMRKNGKLVYFYSTLPSNVFAGVLRPGNLVFSESGTTHDGNTSCSGVLDTLPAYPAPLGFSGNGSGQATFRTGLDVYSSEKSQDLESLAYDQQKAFGCAIIGPGAMPEFQAPEIVDGDGFTWRIDTTTAFLSTDFYKFGKTKKLSNPIARLAAGKSFSFFSGSFKRTLTDNIGGSAEQLTESYVATVSFTRNR